MRTTVSSQRERIVHEQMHSKGKAKTMLAKEARSMASKQKSKPKGRRR